LVLIFQSCKNSETFENANIQKQTNSKLLAIVNSKSNLPFDSVLLDSFFSKYSELTKYKNAVSDIYHKNNFEYVWFDKSGLIEIANTMYNKAIHINDEAVNSVFPYQKS